MWDRVDVDVVRELLPVELCRGPHCGREIRRVMTEAGRRMPIDVDPIPDSTVVIRSDPARPNDVRAFVLAGHSPRHDHEITWRSHFTSCPDSADFRRRRAATQAKCLARCGFPLDPVLARIPGWTAKYHPTCAPVSAPRPQPQQPQDDDRQEELL